MSGMAECKGIVQCIKIDTAGDEIILELTDVEGKTSATKKVSVANLADLEGFIETFKTNADLNKV